MGNETLAREMGVGVSYFAPVLILFLLIVYLQIRLSTKENKFLGLILPLISFSFSYIAAVSEMSESGKVITFFINFLTINTSTVFLLVIWIISLIILKSKKIKVDKFPGHN